MKFGQSAGRIWCKTEKSLYTLDAAVSATLELESYLTPKQNTLSVMAVEEEQKPKDSTVVGAVHNMEKLCGLVKELALRLERLESYDANQWERSRVSQSTPDVRREREINFRGGARHRRGGDDVCWNCGKSGHYARNCHQITNWRHNKPTAGKLDTLNTRGQVFEGVTGVAHKKLFSYAVNPSNGFRLNGTINEIPVSFLLDTGATVTLLREDIWSRISAQRSLPFTQCTSLELVGVDGSPLTVLCSTQVSLRLHGVVVTMDAIVVRQLTTEAILGLDFMKDHDAKIDFSAKSFCLIKG